MNWSINPRTLHALNLILLGGLFGYLGIKIKRHPRVVFSLLICAESGTGKEVVAHAIHRQSQRKDNPFGSSAAPHAHWLSAA